ncbi:13E12 repeat family protein, partial [Mycobacterium sp. Y57]|uniref:DUF222 domain-containing protein n=1 Tax=Mycolicibacterium xanthum TaxID=2796469 RepID=UPI001C865B60
MFDGSLPGPAELAAASDAELIDALTGWARAAAAAEARKLAAAAELLHRRQAEEDNPRRACDAVDGAAAEIAAALTLRHGRALTQLDLAVTLRDRLPKVGAAFLAGQLSTTMITTIHFRTELVEDPHALAALDTALADRAAAWGPLSQYKLDQAIDIWVERHDPDAVRRTRDNIRGRYLSIGKRDDATATTTVHGRLTGPDAALLNTRIAAMIHAVCPDDPRT